MKMAISPNDRAMRIDHDGNVISIDGMDEKDHDHGWRYVARAKYGEDTLGADRYCDIYMRSITVDNGTVTISEKDLRDIICSAWIDGKED
jgi:hypothetical protein